MAGGRFFFWQPLPKRQLFTWLYHTTGRPAPAKHQQNGQN